MHLVAAEIGPWSGVGDDSDKNRAYGRPAVKLDGDRGMPAVGLLVEVAQGEPDIQPGRGLVAVGQHAHDRPTILGVIPDPGGTPVQPTIAYPTTAVLLSST